VERRAGMRETAAAMRAAKSTRHPGAGTPAVRALQRMGVRFKLHTYDFRALDAGIALEAAALMGVDAGRVLKTLMAVVDERTLVVTLVPAGRELNLKALAAAMGGSGRRSPT
jgi:Cys-tRNA(Pro)/Cys-tRNA(Cys) deacylase